MRSAGPSDRAGSARSVPVRQETNLNPESRRRAIPGVHAVGHPRSASTQHRATAFERAGLGKLPCRVVVSGLHGGDDRIVRGGNSDLDLALVAEAG